MDLLYVIKSLEVLTALVAVFYVRKYKEKYFGYFLIYILVLVSFEILIALFFPKDNKHIYNIYTLFEFNLVALIYYNLNQEKFSLKSIKYIMIAFNSIYFFSFYFVNLQDYTVLIGAFLVSCFMILYLKELLNSNKIINYKVNLSFWITVGMLFYYLTTIPFLTLVYVIGLTDKLLYYIIHVITILTHICFIFGILWSQKTMS